MKHVSFPARRTWLKVLHRSALPDAKAWAGTFLFVECHTPAVVAGFHALYRVWRHYALHDNALRIMVPKMMQRFL